MKTPNDILNKRFSTATVVMLMVVLLVAGVIFGTMKNTDAKAANEEQFEFYLTYINALEAEHPYTGSNHIPLEDFQSCLEDWDGDMYFTVELYASALTASQYDVGVIAGVLTYDKSVFSLPTAEGYIQSAQTKSGKLMVDDWDVTLHSSNSDTVGDLVVFSNTDDKQIAQDRLIATISFEILDPDAELNYNTCISYDFDPAYWENQTLLSIASGDYYYYNSVESDETIGAKAKDEVGIRLEGNVSFVSAAQIQTAAEDFGVSDEEAQGADDGLAQGPATQIILEDAKSAISANSSPDIFFEVDECNSMASFVGAQLGIAIMPKIPSLDSYKVIAIPFKGRTVSRTINLLWNNSIRHTPALKNFLDYYISSRSSNTQ